MSQANLEISASTDTGTTLSEKLNAWRAAVYSMQRGATRPSYAIAGFQWLDEVSANQWDWYFFDGTVDIKVAEVDPVNHIFTLSSDNFIIEDVVAKDIDGLQFRSQNGTLVATLGSGNSDDAVFVGTVTANNFVGTLTGSATILQTANYSITEESGKLSFYYGSTKIASMDQFGNFVQLSNVSAYGTP